LTAFVSRFCIITSRNSHVCFLCSLASAGY
jgi:hypothetical protein